MTMLSAAVHESVVVKVFGCRPHGGGAAHTGAGVRKPPMEMLWGKRRDSCKIVASINLQLTELRMQKPHDNSKASPAAFMQDNTLIAVIELSLSNWLVAGLIPGVSRDPLKN